MVKPMCGRCLCSGRGRCTCLCYHRGQVWQMSVYPMSSTCSLPAVQWSLYSPIGLYLTFSLHSSDIIRVNHVQIDRTFFILQKIFRHEFNISELLFNILFLDAKLVYPSGYAIFPMSDKLGETLVGMAKIDWFHGIPYESILFIH